MAAEQHLRVVLCTEKDIPELARMNALLIADEKADNTMTVTQLEQRMAEFVNTGYQAFFFEKGETRVGYALVDMTVTPLYLRQLFIDRACRRQGYGKRSFAALLSHLQAADMDIDVYAWNHDGIAFWKALGFSERYTRMRFQSEA